jgi:hypothetical protein
MNDLASVEVVGTKPDAELLCSLLRSAGIQCMHQSTKMGAGVFEGCPADLERSSSAERISRRLATCLPNVTTDY